MMSMMMTTMALEQLTLHFYHWKVLLGFNCPIRFLQHQRKIPSSPPFCTSAQRLSSLRRFAWRNPPKKGCAGSWCNLAFSAAHVAMHKIEVTVAATFQLDE